MKWDHRWWEIWFLKPSDISREVWLKDFRSILPTRNTPKIPELDSLDCLVHHEWLALECHILWLDSNFFLEFTKRALTKKFIVFYFSTRKGPIPWPGIDMHRTLDKKHMVTMFTDDMRWSWEEDTWHIIFRYWYSPYRLWEHSQFWAVDCSSYKWVWWDLLFWLLRLWDQ